MSPPFFGQNVSPPRWFQLSLSPMRMTLEVALFKGFYVGERGQCEVDRVHTFDHHALVPRAQRELEDLSACCRADRLRFQIDEDLRARIIRRFTQQ